MKLAGKIRKIRWLHGKISHRLPMIIAVAILQIAASYLTVRFALITRNVIDMALEAETAVFRDACLVMAGYIVAILGLNMLCSHISQMLNINMDHDFRRDVMNTILNGDYSCFSKIHSGDLVSRMNNDAVAVYSGILQMVSVISSMFTALATTIGVLLTMAPMFTVVLVLICLMIGSLVLLIQKKMKALQLKASIMNGKVNGFYHETIGKLLIVQALDVSDELKRRAEGILGERLQIWKKRKNLSLLMSFGSGGFSYAGGFITLIWSAYMLRNGRITVGTLIALTSLASQLQGLLMQLPRMLPHFSAISAAVERLMELEAYPTKPLGESVDADELYREMQGISASGLTFAYDRDAVLDNVSFEIPKGGLTVITGSSGVGKSTLLKLMLGIYEPVNGTLEIVTRNGRKTVSRSTRRLFSFAPQGNLLLSGTIRENLLLSKPEASEEEIRRAVYVSAMDEYIAQLPDGLDTRISENAMGLSEGQAQRLSLARAVLSGAPVLLLDEVTSALDIVTEKTVLERIRELEGRTCIAVTHRPAALEVADWRLDLTEEKAVLSAVRR